MADVVERTGASIDLVYGYGLSNGGFMLSQMVDDFAGIAAISGHAPPCSPPTLHAPPHQRLYPLTRKQLMIAQLAHYNPAAFI